MEIVLTIGIPAFRHHSGVRRILASVEDRSDIEILISEDVPLQENGIEDLPNWKNIRYSKNTPPLGAVPNWNTILEQARGEFVWLIHHDEVPKFPKGLDLFLRHLRATHAEMLVSHLDKDADMFLKRWMRNDAIRRILIRAPISILFQNYIGSPSNIILRKSRLQTFDKNLKWFVDTEWFYRLIQNGKMIELSKFEITPFPHEHSIKSALRDRITAISLSEIGYICSKHRVRKLFCWIWRIKILLRDIYIRRRARA